MKHILPRFFHFFILALVFFVQVSQAQPTLLSPVNNATGVNTTPTFSWNAVPGAINYWLRLNEGSTSAPPYIFDTYTGNVTSFTLPAPALKGGTTYCWSLWSWDGSAWSPESERRVFTTVLTAPAIVSPTVGGTGWNFQPHFEWSAINGATNYRFQLSKSNTFATYLVNQNALTDNFYNYTGTLEYQTTYYWRVQAYNGLVTSTFTSGSFTTASNAIPTLSHPINATLVYSLTPRLYWYVSLPSTGLNYQVLVSTSATFPVGPNTFTYLAGTATNFEVTNQLTPGTRYFWQVRTVSLPDYTVIQSSDTASFTTYGAVTPPVQSYPINNALVSTLTPTLRWYTNFSATFYQFEYRYGVTGGAMSAWQNVGQNLSVTLPALQQGTNYTWEVRLYNGSVYSAPSSATFQTFGNAGGLPNVPVLTYPTNGVTVYGSWVTYSWDLQGPSTGVSYKLEVDDNSAFSSPEQISNITSLYYNSSNVANGTYYWRVAATYDGTNYTNWSATGNFTVATFVANSIPNLIYPVDGTVIYTSSATLVWYITALTDVTTYQVQWKVLGTSWSSPAGSVEGLTTSLYIAENLLPGTTYVWRVRAKQGTGSYSAWSEAEQFEVTGSAGSLVPIPITPVDLVTVADNDPVFVWYTNGVSTVPLTFAMELRPNSASFTGIPNYTGLINNFHQVFGLTPGTTYKYKLRTWNGVTWSPWSAVEKFKTPASSNLLAMPSVGSPANNVVLNTNDPVLSWYSPVVSSLAPNYEVQYSLTPDYTNSVTISDISAYSIQLQGLVPGEQYYWRVRGKNPDGSYTYYSADGVFNLNSTTGVEDEVMPSEYKLEQNFPNPFNPATTIIYSIPKSGMVTLKVYDILGKEVAALVSEIKEAGTHKVIFDASGLTSGVYIYKLSTGDVSLSRKLIIMK